MTPFPENSEELGATSLIWERLCGFEKTEEVQNFSSDQIAQTMYLDKVRVLDAIASIQASIAFRAVRACDLYFEWVDKKRSTSPTYIRPRIRIDSRYSTVEMSWVRRLSKTKPSSANEHWNHVKTNSKIGRFFTVKSSDGDLDVFSWYAYIKKGAKDRYPDSIFDKEPAWVRKLGPEVEDKLELLRKEQKILTELRRSILRLDSIQQKQFNENVKAQLKNWNGNRQLKSIYSPNIVLDSKS